MMMNGRVQCESKWTIFQSNAEQIPCASQPFSITITFLKSRLNHLEQFTLAFLLKSHRNIWCLGKHSSRYLTLNSTLLPVAANVSHLNPPLNCSKGLTLTPGPVSITLFVLISSFWGYIVFSSIWCITWATLPSKMLSPSLSHLISVFLCFWLKMVRHDRKVAVVMETRLVTKAGHAGAEGETGGGWIEKEGDASE